MKYHKVRVIWKLNASYTNKCVSEDSCFCRPVNRSFLKNGKNLYQRLVTLQICQIGYLRNLLWGADLFLFSYLPPYLFIFDSSSVLIRILVLRSLTGLMLNAHPLPFYEGQMHYFRSFQHSGLFASCMLPVVSQRFPSFSV